MSAYDLRGRSWEDLLVLDLGELRACAETDGSLGTVCLYQDRSPEAIRRHAYAAALPVDEIVAMADTLVVRPDAQPVPA